MGKKQKKRNARRQEERTLRLKFFDEPQREAVCFALAHAAALALLATPAVPATEYFLDRLEYLEDVLVKTPVSETLTLTRRDALELLSVLSLHLRVLEQGQHPSWVELPGPQHHLALHLVYEILFLQLEQQVHPKGEGRGERNHMDPTHTPPRIVPPIPLQVDRHPSRKDARTWTHD